MNLNSSLWAPLLLSPASPRSRTNLSASPASKRSWGQVGDLPTLVSFFDQMTGEQRSARKGRESPWVRAGRRHAEGRRAGQPEGSPRLPRICGGGGSPLSPGGRKAMGARVRVCM